MNISSPHTALVLGGGGSAGNAWLIGVIAGLHEQGLDVTTADLIIGTSAGSTAAAQITGAAPALLLDETLNAAVPPARPGTADDHLERLRGLISDSRGIADFRRRMGAVALSQEDSSPRWRAIVASRLPSELWPQRDVRITAVDAETGEPVVFDRDSGIELADAIAASCAGGFAYRIGDRAYIDGGYRANADNADLAAGHERVLVLSPLGGRSLHPASWGTHLAGQIDGLRATGSLVETVLPDADSLAAFGDSMMDPSTRPPAARAGFAQGRALADPLRGFWRE